MTQPAWPTETTVITCSSDAYLEVGCPEMLHALLHRKLDESIVEPQRLEDALTSTVFGMLVWMEAWDTLARWLRLPIVSPDAVFDSTANACWFWPRMAFAEPDVVLRLGSFLVVVEAKYRSGRNDRIAANDDAEPTLCDQLELQHRCIATPPDRRRLYADALERAIRECALVQVFIVDRRRLRRASREFAESKLLLADVELNLVTWQDLFRLLNKADAPTARWSTDLLQYLQLVGLDTFEGIGRPSATPDVLGSISRWRAKSPRLGFRQAVADVVHRAPVSDLRLWRAGTSSRS